jgi:GNAT superfamily N-acetyltransferase
MHDELRIVPANEAAWEDLQTIFSAGGDGRWCQCQYFKLTAAQWRAGSSFDERAAQLREQTHCGDPQAPSTSGLVAYLGNEPAGWCAVEPRTAYPRLMRARIPWSGRDEDKNDQGVWAVTCFVVRKGFRRRGVAAALVQAAVDLARDRGAHAVEGYPRVTQQGDSAVDEAMYVGSQRMFAAAGLREVSRPTPLRLVMRIDF